MHSLVRFVHSRRSLRARYKTLDWTAMRFSASVATIIPASMIRRPMEMLNAWRIANGIGGVARCKLNMHSLGDS